MKISNRVVIIFVLFYCVSCTHVQDPKNSSVEDERKQLLDDTHLNQQSCDKLKLLSTNCITIESDEYSYKTVIPLKVIENCKPVGFKARFTVYIIASREINILLSENPHPSKNESVYEYVIGGGTNTYNAIRNVMDGHADLAVDYVQNDMLQTGKPLKFLVEVTTAGNVRLFTENNYNEPLIEGFHENPIDVRFISFASWNHSPNKYFVNCMF